FTGVTVSRKVSLFVAWPSLTATVMVQGPNALGNGVTVTVRLAPLPAKLIAPFGTIDWSEDEPNSDSAVGRLSTSPIVNEMGPVFVSSVMERLKMSEMVGGSLTARMFTSNVRTVTLLDEPSSVTLTVMVAIPLELGIEAKVSNPVLPLV